MQPKSRALLIQQLFTTYFKEQYKMKTYLTFELDDDLIRLWLSDNPTKTEDDFFSEFNNILYLGGDCINAMMERMMEVSVDFYVDADIVNL